MKIYLPMRGGRQRGMVSVIALLVLVSIVTLIAVMTLNVANTGVNDSLNQSSSVAALFLAESGLEYATKQLNSGAESCGAMATTVQSFGRGSFSVVSSASTDYDAVTALPAGECRVQVSGTVSNTNVTRTVQAVVNYSSGVSSIALDSTSFGRTNNGSSFSFTHTVTATGANLELIVGVVIYQGAGETVSYVRYNGTALSKVGVLSTTGLRVEMWHLIAPATGSHNIDVGVTGATGVVAGAMSFTGVDQTTPIENSDFSQCGNGTTATASLTTLTNNAWLVDILGASNKDSVTSTGSGHTAAWNYIANYKGTKVLGSSAYKGPLSPAGLNTMDWSLTKTRDWCLGVAALKPGASSAGVLSWREVVQ